MYARIVVIFFSIVLLSQVITFYQPMPEANAIHQQLIFPPTGGFFRTFDANEPIIISGAIDFLPICFGVDVDDEFSADAFFPTAFVYVIRFENAQGLSFGDELKDISGEPNVVFGSSLGGAFFEQSIGFSNLFGEGLYTIIYDECQDKKFGNVSIPPTPDFAAHPAFEIFFKTTVIPLATISFVDLKGGATEKQLESIFQCALLEAVLDVTDFLQPVKAGQALSRAEKFLWDKAGEGLAKLVPSSGLEIVIASDPKAIAANICLQNGLKYRGLAADPPDPNFKELSPLENFESLNLLSNDQVQLDLFEYTNNQLKEAALVAGLLSSVEKYQGAQNAQSGTWARIHATAIQEYSNLLMGQLTKSNTALSQLENVVTNEPDFDEILADKEEIRLRVQSQGITDEERRDFLNLGVTEELITQLGEDFVARDFSFTKDSALNFLQQEKNRNIDLISSLNDFSADIATFISDYESDPLVTIPPLADAGGPYLGAEGESIQFDGSRSSSSSEIILYEWDFDGDGEFDDASGSTPSSSFNNGFSGFVGLRVTNENLFSDIDYSLIEITSINRPPIIDSFLPDDFIPEVRLGNVLEFSVVTSDPDADNTNVEWFVDFESVSSGEMFLYNPTNPDQVGPRIIIAVVTDDNPLGGRVVHEWNIMVLEADNDGDEWNANADCDDANPNVNPGQLEILGNSLDDDCDSDTPDVGEEPIANFSFFPDSPFVGRGIQFIDRSVDDVGIVSFEWDFGDGNTSFEPNPMHMYDNVDEFTVRLQVTDNDGNTDSIQLGPIVVQGNPPQNQTPLAFDVLPPDRFLTTQSGFGYGNPVASGDLNNDGFDDFIAAEPRLADVFVYFGGPGPFDTTFDVKVPVINGGNLNAGPHSLAVGDVNKDGIDDLVVGAQYSSETAEINGAVSVFFGGDGSFDNVRDDFLEVDRPVFDLQNVGEPNFGSGVGIGDVNGDGENDIVVGVRRAIYDPFPFSVFGIGGIFENSRHHGEVHVFFGGTGDFSQTADLVLRQNFELEGFIPPIPLDLVPIHTGMGVNIAIGDINGDGIDDILTGCPECDSILDGNLSFLSGKVLVYFGSRDQIGVTKPWGQVNDLFLDREISDGNEVHGFGTGLAVYDINKDGFSDVAIGSPSRIGDSSPIPDVRIFYGSENFDTNSDVTISAKTKQLFGRSINIGDFNHDMFGDILIGQPGFGSLVDAGPTQIFFGGPGFEFDTNPDVTLLSNMNPSNFGDSVASGDINMDGFDDALVGDPKNNLAELFYMPPPPVTTLEETPVEIPLQGRDADSDQLQFFESQPPSNGNLGEIVSTGPDTASVTYTPNRGFVGEEVFSYKGHDVIDISNLANVRILVLPATQPRVDCSFFPQQPYVGRGVMFSTNSFDPDGQIVLYEWDLGDGTISNDVNPMHMYDVAGAFSVSLRVTDNDGNSNETQCGQVIVQEDPPANSRPDALDLPRPPTFTVGPGGLDSYGGQMASGDLNNDGFEDLITGDIKSFVDIIFGGPGEFGTNGVVTLRPENGGSVNPFIPFTFATGDVNDDEIDDLVIGRGRSGVTEGWINGAVSIYYGGDGSFDTTPDELFEVDRPVIPGTGPPRFGANVGVGDVNGDSLNDVIVGVSRAIYDPFPSEFFGFGGKFENPSKHGEIHIFLGGSPHNIITDSASPTGRVTADIVLQRDFIQEGYGPTELGGTGFATEGAIGDILVVDDISGDGIDDIIFGCIDCSDIASAFPPSNRSTRLDGKVMAFFGNTDASKIGNINQVTLENLFNRDTGEFEDVTFTLSHYDLLLEKDDPAFRETEHFGSSIATGDINGDGALDLVVGSSSRQNPSSVLPDVRVYFGGSNPFDTVPDAVIFSSELNLMGSSVEVADFNGDGFGDVLVGTPEGTRRTNGFAQVFYGGPGEFDIKPDKHLLPSDVDGLFGQKVFSMNSDDDEFDEAVIGLPGVRKVSLIKLSTALQVLENVPLNIGLLGDDGDENLLNFFVSDPPSHGSLSSIASTGLESSDVTYTPNNGYTGPDRFSLKNHDGVDISNLANVDIIVNPNPQTSDTTPPVLMPPLDLIIQATAPDGQPVNLGKPTVTDDLDPKPSVTNDAPPLFPIGTTIVTWRATDGSGNFAEATQRVTIKDDTPPQINILSPIDGNNFAEGTSIEISVDATDNVKVDKVEFFEDGTKIGEDTSTPFSLQYSAPNLELTDQVPRAIVLEARAFDLAGNSATDDITIQVFDVSPPPIPSLALPPDQSLFFNESPILAWKAVEDVSSPITYDPRLINVDNPSEPFGLTLLDSLAAQPPVLPNGNYQWQVKGTDSAGNESPFSNFFTFSIDTILPPATTLLLPPNDSTLDNPQSELLWEDVSGTDELFYLPRLGNVVEPDVPIELVSLSLTSAEPVNVLSDGTYQWMVTVQDLAGNKAESSVFRFTISTSPPGPTLADHYLGYDVKKTKGTAKFVPLQVTLTDQFEENVLYKVTKPDMLFNPVDKHFGDDEVFVQDFETHLKAYKIKHVIKGLKDEKQLNVEVQNQFGSITVNTFKADVLLVPSSKSTVGPIGELEPPLTVDHFKCYKVKIDKNAPIQFEQLQVTLRDHNFESEKVYDVKKPKRLCNPVEKEFNGEVTPIQNPEIHLMCYDVKKVKGEAKFEKRSVFTNNQFGPEQLDVKKEKELCVPSTKILPP